MAEHRGDTANYYGASISHAHLKNLHPALSRSAPKAFQVAGSAQSFPVVVQWPYSYLYWLTDARSTVTQSTTRSFATSLLDTTCPFVVQCLKLSFCIGRSTMDRSYQNDWCVSGTGSKDQHQEAMISNPIIVYTDLPLQHYLPVVFWDRSNRLTPLTTNFRTCA